MIWILYQIHEVLFLFLTFTHFLFLCASVAWHLCLEKEEGEEEIQQGEERPPVFWLTAVPCYWYIHTECMFSKLVSYSSL